jgi:hypothetical protein
MKEPRKRRRVFRVKPSEKVGEGDTALELRIALDSGITFHRDRIEHVTRIEFPSREDLEELRDAIDEALK